MACGFLRELPNQGPALPISYQSYPLPAGSQFTRGKTQMGITCVIPIWVTTTLDLDCPSIPPAMGKLRKLRKSFTTILWGGHNFETVVNLPAIKPVAQVD